MNETTHPFLRIENIEVVQVIQNLDQPHTPNNELYPVEPDHTEYTLTPSKKPLYKNMPVFRGKETYIRIYFGDVPTQLKSYPLVGELELTGSSGPLVVLKSLEGVTLFEPYYPVSEQRKAWDRSLNFKVPAALTFESISVKNLTLKIEHSDEPVPINTHPALPHPINFIQAPDFRIRVLIIRYLDVDSKDWLEPTNEQVDAIRRGLNSLFPIKDLKIKDDPRWSTIRIEATEELKALNKTPNWNESHDEHATKLLTAILLQALSHRNHEIFSTDRSDHNNTFYIAAMLDPSGRFGGIAMDAPGFPTAHVVGAAAVDSDEMIAIHELAHMLGRQHPGIPAKEIYGNQIGQSSIDTSQGIHSLGQISPTIGDINEYLGLDSRQGVSEPAILCGDRWFDLMTYRYPQWISPHTYIGIWKQLKGLESIRNSSTSINNNRAKFFTLVCTYDINQRSGEIVHFLPSKIETPFPKQNTQKLLARFQNDTQGEALDALLNLTELESYAILKVIDQLPESDKTILDYYRIEFDKLGTGAETKGSAFKAFQNALSLMQHAMQNSPSSSMGLAAINNSPNQAQAPGPGLESQKTEIKMVVEYQNDESETSEVYFRRVYQGNRYPFGLFQHSVKIQKSKPIKSITLIVNGETADRITLPPDQEIGEIRYCENPAQSPEHENENPNINQLFYDIRDGQYYFNFNWPMVDYDQPSSALPQQRVTTTIMCKRPGQAASNRLWETVYISDKLESKVWISREFIDQFRGNQNTDPATFEYHNEGNPGDNYFFDIPPERPLHFIKEDKVTLAFSLIVNGIPKDHKVCELNPHIVGTRIKEEGDINEYERRDRRFHSGRTPHAEKNRDGVFQRLNQ